MKIETYGFPFDTTLISAVNELEKLQALKNDKLYIEIWYNAENGEVFTRVNEDKTLSTLHMPSHNLSTVFITTATSALTAQTIVNKITTKLMVLGKSIPATKSSFLLEL